MMTLTIKMVLCFEAPLSAQKRDQPPEEWRIASLKRLHKRRLANRVHSDPPTKLPVSNASIDNATIADNFCRIDTERNKAPSNAAAAAI
jgi:hypothetical protein